MPRPKPASFWESFVQEICQIIWAVAGGTALLSSIINFFATGLEGAIPGLALIVFSIIIILITSLIDFLKDSAYIRQQELLKEEFISVIRGKPYSTRSISVWDLVVGDVILLETGNKVPADCLILESTGVKVDEPHDEADVTEPKAKDSFTDAMLQSGSILKSGNAKAIVCCVGESSIRGIKDVKLDTDQQTVLQSKLNNIGKRLILYAIIAAAVVFVQLVIYTIIGGVTGGTAVLLGRAAQAFNYTVVLAIACIPEGLPLTIGLALAFSIGQMHKKDGVLVRDLSSPETMGKVEEILVGKSGTITNAKMRVQKFIVNGESYTNSRKDTIKNCQLSEDTLQKIKESVLFNTQARIEAGETTYAPTGSPTDVACINFLQDADYAVHLFIQRKFGDSYICELNLRSDQRYSAVAVKSYDDPSKTFIYVKGAPETVLGMCSSFAQEEGEEFEFNKELKEVTNYAKDGLRCISFAYMETDTEDFVSRMRDGGNVEQNF
jgi:magnesium-transporting ATPase (P-type)